MKRTLEAFVIAGAVLLAAFLIREAHERMTARPPVLNDGVGETSDPPVPGAPSPQRAVQSLPPILTHARSRVLRESAPPPPPATAAAGE